MYTIYSGSLHPDDLVLNPKEAALRLGVPADKVSQWSEDCIRILKTAMQPKYCYFKTTLDTTHLSSKDLCKNLTDCTDVYVMAMTLGLETDRLIAKTGITSPAKAYLLDALASAYAESLADAVSAHIHGQLPQGFILRPRYSPGYGDLPLSVQPKLLEALQGQKYLGITLGNNLLMTPRKSITALQGVKPI